MGYENLKGSNNFYLFSENFALSLQSNLIKILVFYTRGVLFFNHLMVFLFFFVRQELKNRRELWISLPNIAANQLNNE